MQANGDQAVDNYYAAYPSTFTKYSNGSAGNLPVPGDVLSLSAVSTFNGADGGHTGVVVSSDVNSSGNGSIRVAEQNYGGSTGGSGYHDYTVTSWTVQYAWPAVHQVAPPEWKRGCREQRVNRGFGRHGSRLVQGHVQGCQRRETVYLEQRFVARVAPELRNLTRHVTGGREIG